MSDSEPIPAQRTRPLKVATILGTRPEIIRLSRVIPKLDALCHHVLVHTGQNWDAALSDVFFAELGLRAPDHFLGAGGVSLGATLAAIMIGTERVLESERPDAVLILGDTNSALAAIIARRLKIPIYHMEAGNRSFDRNVPEEANRRIVDHIADWNLVYTEHARRHLLAEGIEPRRIYLTGSPMREVLDNASQRIKTSGVLARHGLQPGRFALASLHREENVDDPARLARLLLALSRLAHERDIPVILSTHPRTARRLHAFDGTHDPHINFEKPFGFYDFCALQRDAFCTISDSGTIAEEAAILGFPAVTPRDAIERPEALDCGSVVMTGTDPDDILRGVDTAVRLHAARRTEGRAMPMPEGYAITDTSDRVAALIMGTARLSAVRDGIRYLPAQGQGKPDGGRT